MKGSTTTAEVPAEYKALARNTGYNMTNLQNLFWSPGANGTGLEVGGPNMPPGGLGKLVPEYDDSWPPAIGSGGGAHGRAYGSGGGANAEPATPIDPVTGPTGRVRRNLSGGGSTPPDDTAQGQVGGFITQYDPALTPGMSTTQKLARSLLPAMAGTPGEENAAWDIARSSIASARELPNDWGSWSRAGRLPTLSVRSMMQPPDSGGGHGGSGGGANGGDGGGAFEPPETIPSPASSTPGVGAWITDPTIRAAREIFDSTQSEQIKNAMSQAGLGRSTATGDALAKGWGSQLMPLIESQLGRQERGIERQQAAEEAQLAREQAGIERGQQAMQFAANLGMQRGAADTARYGQTEQAAERIGALEREITQGQVDAGQREKLRLQALAEQSLFGPMGGFLPSTIGSSTGKSK